MFSSQELRAEAWALGARHGGEVLEGAKLELAYPSISSARARLLKAVIKMKTE